MENAVRSVDIPEMLADFLKTSHGFLFPAVPHGKNRVPWDLEKFWIGHADGGHHGQVRGATSG